MLSFRIITANHISQCNRELHIWERLQDHDWLAMIESIPCSAIFRKANTHIWGWSHTNNMSLFSTFISFIKLFSTIESYVRTFFVLWNVKSHDILLHVLWYYMMKSGKNVLASKAQSSVHSTLITSNNVIYVSFSHNIFGP